MLRYIIFEFIFPNPLCKGIKLLKSNDTLNVISPFTAALFNVTHLASLQEFCPF